MQGESYPYTQPGLPIIMQSPQVSGVVGNGIVLREQRTSAHAHAAPFSCSLLTQVRMHVCSPISSTARFQKAKGPVVARGSLL